MLRITFLVVGLLFWFPANVLASPDSVTIFCQKYAGSNACKDPSASCSSCHAGPPSLNPYGIAIEQEVAGDLKGNLIQALDAVANLDSDDDGVPNEKEILHGGHPGDKKIKPSTPVSLSYDRTMAFKRIKTIYCGRPASYQELQTLKTSSDPKTYMHDELDKCLNSDYWIKEALHRMADKRIQPLSATGFGSNVVIGDYRFDYRLFAYIMSGDRDVRDLLKADYHVDESYNRIEGTVPREEPFQLNPRIVIAGGEPLAPNRRVGMITTQWFLSNFTMFSELPRNTAAQAYRAYLGLDLAKGEGIIPVAGEPRDVDNRYVAQKECAVCHSTLDPLAYSFASYRGIDIDFSLVTNSIGTYNPNRTPWGGDGVIFGEPVDDLLAWAEKARNSDYFKINVAKMIFENALSRSPLPHESDEFESLWKGLPEQDYSVNNLIHRFVETNAFAGRVQP